MKDYVSNNREYTFEEMLSQRGYIAYTSVGCSMRPFLRQKRDIIVIHAKNTKRCQKYDVVLYKRGDDYILHRILKVLPEGYIIAGDNNCFIERDITDENIIGVMTKVIRDGKEISMNDFGYRLYVHIWCDFYPLRISLFRIMGICRKKVAKLIRLAF